jgi:Sporulation and spore germination.
MLKRMSIKKIITSSIVLAIVFMIYIFPNNNKKEDIVIPTQISYVNTSVQTHTIYLLDNNNYISKTSIRIQSNTPNKIAKELVLALIQEETNSDQIPNGFKSLINCNTKINSLKITEDTIKLDLSKDFLDTSKEMEEKILEALVYTLTSIEGIDKLVLYIDGEILTLLPQNNIKLPATLSRDIGINKQYRLTGIKNIEKTTIYYVNKYNDNYYYTPVTKINNDSREKIEIIIDELSSNFQDKLMSFLNTKTTLLNYEYKNNIMKVNFDENIFNSLEEKDILEEVLYTISFSIYDNYNTNEVIFQVNDKEITKTVLKSIE